ncbi:unnamed protein product (macronuclear) [Paramecium tetraurelia]|uniref:Chromosome undetermined scaffold_1, whole genome shotgun sequence n=1 Tax=Paramecium tetraurelia TaxID=5888 RepID=Q6BGF4_PARTE|nr:hypothetical protein [Paramecium tetraurelia strain d4-2]XP_001423441.1 uncharacterized protein GSPATT00000478001 [Paramecium tetraurelia]CAH03266.1 hypothetical protein PTMB.69c [Paramecium tetraurelia]CAK56043.1 unnamed protein product [Paramecium tetraurelia]|eukprot:XP_001423441.1 hypothetical protein (macronuclear) [Paramecium tetraurelia strain d4-2]
MMAQADFIEFKASRSHSQYKLNSIDFDDFAYNLNKTIYNFQKSQEGKTIDKISKFRRAKSFLYVKKHESTNAIYQTFSRNAPGFDENETKELMELILQLEYLFILYHKFYPDQSNPVLLTSYLNCLTYNKEKYFDNYTNDISETLQMSILRNSQQRIIEEKTDENLIKFLVNEINRRNKYKKNMQLIRSDLNKFQKLQQNYEIQRKTKQLEHTKSNMLVASLKIVFQNTQNHSINVRFPLIDQNKSLCLDFEKLLKQGDIHDLFKQWNNYIDITSSHSEITLLISIVQDLFQEESWIIKSILEQVQDESIISIDKIILQIGALTQFCPKCLNVMDRSHKEIAYLLQSKLQKQLLSLQINENLSIQKQVMIMQNSQEELQKEDERHSLENALLQSNNLKMCLIPQGLMSQLFFIHRYSDNGTQAEEEEEQHQIQEQKQDSQQKIQLENSQIKFNRQFVRQASRRTSLISFGYSEMQAEYSDFEPLRQKLTDMKIHSTVYMENADKKEWKKIFDKIKQEKMQNQEFLKNQSISSNSSFEMNCIDEKFLKQMKVFLQNQQMRRQ